MANKFDPNADIDPSEFETVLEDKQFNPDADIDPSEFENIPTDDTTMSAIDAAIVGAGEGASFGLDEILAGVSAGAGHLVGSLSQGELPGSGDDSQNMLEALRETYYEAKDGRKELKEKAMDDQTSAYLGGNIGMGILSGGAAGKAAAALSKGGKVAQLASNILPSAGEIGKGATVGAKMGKAAIEGAKVGGITSFGLGDSKLLEGDIKGTASDISKGLVTGGVLSGGLSGGMQGFKAIASGIGKDVIKGHGYTKEWGKFLNKANVKADIEKLSKRIANMTNRSLSKAGVDKKRILKMADEAGERIAIGDDMDRVIDNMMSKELYTLNDSARNEYVSALKDLIGNDQKIAKSVAKLNKSRAIASAKSVDVIGQVKSVIDGDTGMNVNTALIPDKGILANATELTTGSIKDVDNMSPSQITALIDEIRNYTFIGDSKGGSDMVKNDATKLVKMLTSKLNQMSENHGDIKRINKNFNNLYYGKDKAGFPKKGTLTKSQYKQESSDAINKLIRGSTPDSGELTLDRAMDSLSAAEPKLIQYIEPMKSLGIASNLVSSSGNSNSLTSLVSGGGLASGLAKVGSSVAVVQSIPSKLANNAANFTKRIIKSSPEQIQELAAVIEAKGSPHYAEIMKNISGSSSKTKNAIMFKLHQEPAFRKMMEDIRGDSSDE